MVGSFIFSVPHSSGIMGKISKPETVGEFIHVNWQLFVKKLLLVDLLICYSCVVLENESILHGPVNWGSIDPISLRSTNEVVGIFLSLIVRSSVEGSLSEYNIN